MFEHTNNQDNRVTHARYCRRIIEDGEGTVQPNVTIEVEEGYFNKGEFIALGRSSICFKNEPAILEVKDADDKVIIPGKAEITDFSDYAIAANIAPIATIETFASEKIQSKASAITISEASVELVP